MDRDFFSLLLDGDELSHTLIAASTLSESTSTSIGNVSKLSKEGGSSSRSLHPLHSSRSRSRSRSRSERTRTLHAHHTRACSRNSHTSRSDAHANSAAHVTEMCAECVQRWSLVVSLQPGDEYRCWVQCVRPNALPNEKLTCACSDKGVILFHFLFLSSLAGPFTSHFFSARRNFFLGGGVPRSTNAGLVRGVAAGGIRRPEKFTKFLKTQ